MDIVKEGRELLTKIVFTFSGSIGLLQMDMMFWEYYWSSPNHGKDWIDVWMGNTPILVISDYNCWIIFQLCCWAVLIGMWIEYFVRRRLIIKALIKKAYKSLKTASSFVYHKLYK